MEKDVNPDNWKVVELAPRSWRRYKKLRLEALHYDPSAFADSYAEGRGKPPSVWQNRLKTAQKGTELKLFFGEHEGELVGMVGLEFDLRDKRLHVAKIRELYVTPSWRSAGVGRALVEYALEYIRKKRRGIKKLALSVNKTQLPAVKLYESLGFEIIGCAKREIKVHGYFLDQYLMEKYY